ncbi:uncharacterized protein [Palaemon carinicauda]|uniref:uncharacterized protein n=1 Tax=Palaemon carinicauda TaxID=392227 RepID=UPI0035B5B8B4
MTYSVLASAVPVDHPRSSARKLSASQTSTSRPGTPIVTPRTTTPSVSRPPSRSVSRLTTFGPHQGEQQLEELGEEEEEDQENSKNLHQRNRRLTRSVSQELAEEVESSEELLSGASLVSISETDTFPPSSAPSTPPRGRPSSQTEEGRRLGFSATCGRPSCAPGHLKSLSRALTAASASYRTRHSKYCNCSSTHLLNEVAMVDAQVIYASSHDPQFPPAAIMDGRRETFWVSSGLYPQFLVVSLPGLTSIDNVNIVAYNVRKISVARSIKKQPTDFEEIAQEELNQDEGKLQESPILSQNVSAIFLRISIEEAYDHFCAVHSLRVTGSVSNQGNNSSALPAKKTLIADTPIPPKESTLAIREVPSYQKPHEIEQPSSVKPINVAPMDEDDIGEDFSPMVEDIGPDMSPTVEDMVEDMGADLSPRAEDIVADASPTVEDKEEDLSPRVEKIGADMSSLVEYIGDDDEDDMFPVTQVKGATLIKAVGDDDADDLDEF